MVNILIIDDREEHLFVLTEMFESSVFNLYTAASYHEAVRIIQSADHPWHCWIADFDLAQVSQPRTSSMRKMLCEIDLEKAQGYPGRYLEHFSKLRSCNSLRIMP